VPIPTGTSATVGQGAPAVIDRGGNLSGPVPIRYSSMTVGLRSTTSVAGARICLQRMSGTVSRTGCCCGIEPLVCFIDNHDRDGLHARPDPAALVLAPRAWLLTRRRYALRWRRLPTLDYSIGHASTATTAVNKGALVFSDTHLRGPLALRFAPNGICSLQRDAINARSTQPQRNVSSRSQVISCGNTTSMPQGGAFGSNGRR